MRYGVFGRCKRIRPILALESCRACGGNPRQALPAACAIELVHTYSLIHDDLPAMDDDDFRRGKPTVHKKFGEATAILAGDGLLTLAFEVIAGYSKPEIASRMALELARAAGTLGMVGGQVMDLAFEGKAKDRKTIEYINLNKTARLFEVSCRMGAIAAGAPSPEIKALARFGRFFGLSFQIVDDIMDKGPYVRRFGMAAARKDAGLVMKKARGSLRIFGKKAEGLKEITDQLLKRRG
jgi:geranylgeranyl diphosphate synthase type II